MNRFRPWWSIGLVVLVMLQGCRRADRSPLGYVVGTVLYKSKPVSQGTLIFEVSGSRPAYAKIVEGEIREASTYQPGDGVPVGLARIAVFVHEESKPAGAGGTPSMDVKSLVPTKYNDTATSDLACEIHPGKNHVLLELNGP